MANIIQERRDKRRDRRTILEPRSRQAGRGESRQAAAAGGSEAGLPMITAGGDEVFVAAGVEALQTFGHGDSF